MLETYTSAYISPDDIVLASLPFHEWFISAKRSPKIAPSNPANTPVPSRCPDETPALASQATFHHALKESIIDPAHGIQESAIRSTIKTHADPIESSIRSLSSSEQRAENSTHASIMQERVRKKLRAALQSASDVQHAKAHRADIEDVLLPLNRKDKEIRLDKDTVWGLVYVVDERVLEHLAQVGIAERDCVMQKHEVTFWAEDLEADVVFPKKIKEMGKGVVNVLVGEWLEAVPVSMSGVTRSEKDGDGNGNVEGTEDEDHLVAQTDVIPSIEHEESSSQSNNIPSEICSEEEGKHNPRGRPADRVSANPTLYISPQSELGIDMNAAIMELSISYHVPSSYVNGHLRKFIGAPRNPMQTKYWSNHKTLKARSSHLMD